MKHLLVLVICSIFLCSCYTFHMSTQSLVEQVSNPDLNQNKKRKYVEWVPFMGPMPIIGQKKYIYMLSCYDKKEQEHAIRITKRTLIKITKKDGSKVKFYYNTIKIQDSAVTGAQSHIINLKINPIKLNDILKIKIDPSVIEFRETRVLKSTNIANDDASRYNSLLKEGDSFMFKKQYDDAISKYHEASILFPKKSYPKAQIEKANSLKK